MKRVQGAVVALNLAGAALGSALLVAQQPPKGDWAMNGGDSGQSGWQKAESKLSPESVPKSFKFLWKIQLGKPAEAGAAYTEPLLAPRLINAQGFKDIVYWPSTDTLYAVDSELGNILWTKQFNVKPHDGASGCGASNLGIVMEPPAVINFNARRAPGTPAPVQPGPMAINERRLGVSPGGGGFGLRGIYVLTHDGILHEQVLTTGADFAPPVKFLPAADAGAYGINILGKTIYTTTGRDCRGTPNGFYAIDIGNPAYPVTNYALTTAKPLSLTGPTTAPDGTSFVLTGGSGTNSHSLLAIGKDMQVKDSYTPATPLSTTENVSPVTIAYKGKQYVVAPGGNGSFVLLDASALHTPVSETASFSGPTAKHGWDGFASFTDKQGATWVYASISAAIITKEKSATSTGSTTHGGILAFRIDDADQKPILTPVWISGDMLNPAPPVVANGVLVALAGGDAHTHATLHVLEATTGKSLYVSKDEIPTYTHLAGLALGDSHVFFADHNGTLYSFGIGLEH